MLYVFIFLLNNLNVNIYYRRNRLNLKNVYNFGSNNNNNKNLYNFNSPKNDMKYLESNKNKNWYNKTMGTINDNIFNI